MAGEILSRMETKKKKKKVILVRIKKRKNSETGHEIFVKYQISFIYPVISNSDLSEYSLHTSTCVDLLRIYLDQRFRART